MSEFFYKARNSTGDLIVGSIDAENDSSVVEILTNKGLTPISVGKDAQQTRKKTLSFNLNFSFGTGIKSKEITFLIRQISAMLGAGIPVMQCLDNVIVNTKKPSLNKTLISIRNDIQSGGSLSSGLAKYPNIFSNLIIRMVASGESGGILDVTLSKLSDILEQNEDIKRKIKGALTYPVFIGIMSTLVVGVVLIWVLPKFTEIFTSAHIDLPLPTQILINVSSFLKNHFFLFSLLVAMIIISLKLLKNSSKGTLLWHKAKLKIPLAGTLILKSALARFANTLGVLISAGVPLTEALIVSGQVTDNKILLNNIIETEENVRSGQGFSKSLSAFKLFPSLFIQMIFIGEESGELEKMAKRIANFYEKEVNDAIKTLSSVLEPVILVLMGIVLGGIIIAMLLPMFKMASIAGVGG
ncbi:MAG: type II secretion system F family protein [bacterium]